MSATWSMRYRFRLATRLSAEADTIDLQLGDRPVALRARTGGPLRDARYLVLLAKGFDTEARARTFGDRVRHALLNASVVTKIGVDVGEDKATSRAAPRVKDAILEKHGVSLLDNVHGLMLYPDTPTPRVLSAEGTGTVHVSPDTFLGALAQAFDDEVAVPKELEVPIELYCASCMEPSPVAQLILAVSAIEAVLGDESERPSRPSVELELLALARQTVEQAKADRNSRNAVLGSLDKLGKAGVRRAGRKFVNTHLPGEGATCIEVYDYRGRIAHRHKRPDRAQAAAMAHTAQRLASELIASLWPKMSGG